MLCDNYFFFKVSARESVADYKHGRSRSWDGPEPPRTTPLGRLQRCFPTSGSGCGVFYVPSADPTQLPGTSRIPGSQAPPRPPKPPFSVLLSNFQAGLCRVLQGLTGARRLQDLHGRQHNFWESIMTHHHEASRGLFQHLARPTHGGRPRPPLPLSLARLFLYVEIQKLELQGASGENVAAAAG